MLRTVANIREGSRDGVHCAVVFFKSLLEAQIELKANLSAVIAMAGR